MPPVSLGYRTDLALLRLGGSSIEDRGDHLVVRSPHNPHFWWGNFLLLPGVPAAADSPAWLTRFAAEFPQAQHVALGFDAVDGSAEQLRPFAERGFDVEASVVLAAGPAQLQAPRRPNTAARMRQMASDADWAQSVDLRVRCWDGPVDPHLVEYSAARATTYRQLAEAGDGAWFGAFMDDELVCQLGVVRAGDGLVRYQAVETHPDWRRLGHAGTLVHAAGLHAIERWDARTLVIVADPDYAAVGLYRSLGFTDVERQLQALRPPAG